MGGPRLTPEEIERRDKYNKRYSALFQRIKKLFNNRDLIANISDLSRRLFNNKNIDPFVRSDDEF
jgi:hypothetical protein